MGKVKIVVENSHGEIVRVITDEGKEINSDKAMLLIKMGTLKGLRLETQPFSNKSRIGVVSKDIRVEKFVS